MRFFLSFDLEGIAGACAPPQMMPNGFDWARFRRLATAEVSTAVTACVVNGAVEVIVCDGHGSAQNLLVEDLPKEAKLVSGWPRPFLQMEGIDAGPYAGALFVGYHASASAARGTLAHTFFTSAFHDVQLNGHSVSEFDLNVMLAGHFGIPPIYSSGDDGHIEQVKRSSPDTITSQTKMTRGTYCAIMDHPVTVNDLIKTDIAKTIAKVEQISPVKPPSELELRIEFKSRLAAETLSFSGIGKRHGALSYVFYPQDMPSLMRLLSFLIFYSPTGNLPF